MTYQQIAASLSAVADWNADRATEQYLAAMRSKNNDTISECERSAGRFWRQCDVLRRAAFLVSKMREE